MVAPDFGSGGGGSGGSGSGDGGGGDVGGFCEAAAATIQRNADERDGGDNEDALEMTRSELMEHLWLLVGFYRVPVAREGSRPQSDWQMLVLLEAICKFKVEGVGVPMTTTTTTTKSKEGEERETVRTDPNGGQARQQQQQSDPTGQSILANQKAITVRPPGPTRHQDTLPDPRSAQEVITARPHPAGQSGIPSDPRSVQEVITARPNPTGNPLLLDPQHSSQFVVSSGFSFGSGGPKTRPKPERAPMRPGRVFDDVHHGDRPRPKRQQHPHPHLHHPTPPARVATSNYFPPPRPSPRPSRRSGQSSSHYYYYPKRKSGGPSYTRGRRPIPFPQAVAPLTDHESRQRPSHQVRGGHLGTPAPGLPTPGAGGKTTHSPPAPPPPPPPPAASPAGAVTLHQITKTLIPEHSARNVRRTPPPAASGSHRYATSPVGGNNDHTS